MLLYVNVVYQATQIFDIGAAFALGLINIIKKDKSFETELWTKNQVNLLIVHIKYYMKATKVGRSQHKKMLKMINKY